MEQPKPQKLCYNCRKPVEPTVVVCEECQDKPIKASPTLIIYDKI